MVGSPPERIGVSASRSTSVREEKSLPKALPCRLVRGLPGGARFFAAPQRGTASAGEMVLMEMFKDNDLVGYEALLDVMRRAGVDRLPGDVLEVGAFLGGGTRKLAEFCLPLGRTVHTIDLMEPAVDSTKNAQGFSMADLYGYLLAGRRQEDVFFDTVRGCGNVSLIRQDSRTVSFPGEQRFCFAFIDGNHDPAYVRSDFLLAWRHLVPGGVVGFHDFEGDLPWTTDAIRQLLAEFAGEIDRTEQVREKWLLFVFKKR